jgi:hypothetical protein
MKILVDGCVFTELRKGKLVNFWTAVLTSLSTPQNGIYVYFLNREWTSKVSHRLKVINLHAPKVEWERSALEDRRLALLCKELGVDVFVSSYYTSAGAQVRSLAVSYDDSVCGRRKTEWQALSEKRARNLACATWAVPNYRRWKQASVVTQFIENLYVARDRALDAKELERRAREEDLTIRQANALRAAAFHDADPARHRHQKAQPPSFASRVFKALAAPQRYPAYGYRIICKVREKWWFGS